MNLNTLFPIGSLCFNTLLNAFLQWLHIALLLEKLHWCILNINIRFKILKEPIPRHIASDLAKSDKMELEKINF